MILTVQVHDQWLVFDLPLDELKQQLVVPGRTDSYVLELTDSVELHIHPHIPNLLCRVVILRQLNLDDLSILTE